MYSLPNIIKIVISRQTKWAVYMKRKGMIRIL